MTIPSGYTLFTWYNQIVGNLNVGNTDLLTFQKYWAQLTPTQRIQIKTSIKNTIDTAITELTALKADIDAV